jgi:hypothetical protein
MTGKGKNMEFANTARATLTRPSHDLHPAAPPFKGLSPDHSQDMGIIAIGS